MEWEMRISRTKWTPKWTNQTNDVCVFFVKMEMEMEIIFNSKKKTSPFFYSFSSHTRFEFSFLIIYPTYIYISTYIKEYAPISSLYSFIIIPSYTKQLTDWLTTPQSKEKYDNERRRRRWGWWWSGALSMVMLVIRRDVL